MKFAIGDKVKLKKGIPLYKSSNSIITTSFLKQDKITYITRYAPGTKHPYNTTGDLGWINESDIESLETKEKYEVEIELVDKDHLMEYIKEHDDKIVMIDSKTFREVLDL